MKKRVVSWLLAAVMTVGSFAPASADGLSVDETDIGFEAGAVQQTTEEAMSDAVFFEAEIPEILKLAPKTAVTANVPVANWKFKDGKYQLVKEGVDASLVSEKISADLVDLTEPQSDGLVFAAPQDEVSIETEVISLEQPEITDVPDTALTFLETPDETPVIVEAPVEAPVLVEGDTFSETLPDETDVTWVPETVDLPEDFSESAGYDLESADFSDELIAEADLIGEELVDLEPAYDLVGTELVWTDMEEPDFSAEYPVGYEEVDTALVAADFTEEGGLIEEELVDTVDETIEPETVQEQSQVLFETIDQAEELPVVVEDPVIGETDSETLFEVVQDIPEQQFEEKAIEVSFTELADPAAAGSETEDGVSDDLVEDAANYYTSADGLVQVTTVMANGSSHTGVYLFDTAGFMLTGEQTNEGNTYYLTTQAEARLDSSISASEGKTPYNSTYGQVITSSWRWIKKTRRFRYYDANGVYQNVEKLTATYKAQGNFPGYFTIGGAGFALDEKGKPRTGTINLTHTDGKTYTYYFSAAKDSNGIYGRMFHDGWMRDKTSKGIRYRYFSPQAETLGRMIAHKMQVITPVGSEKKYLIARSGYVLKNVCKKAGDGKIYQTDKTGAVFMDRFGTFKGLKYYYGSDGGRVSWKDSWNRVPGDENRYYYFGKKSQVVKTVGWQKIYEGNTFIGWFFFYPNGKHKINAWISSNTRYCTSNGKLASGVTNVDGKMYYFTPCREDLLQGRIAKSKIVSEGNNTYYATANGVLKQSGWVTYNGYSYLLNDYKALKNQAVSKDGVKGWLDSEGRFLKSGWNVVDDANNLVKYVNPATGKAVVNTSMVINGLTYYFDKDGYRLNDVTDKVSGKYYLEVDRVNGVITIYNASKTIPVKSVRCSVGAAGTETPLGTFTVTPYARWATLMGPSYGQYGSVVTGNILIHSVPLATPTVHGVPRGEYARLGSPASHGCIRVCVADAKWIFENCGGCTIRIFDGTYSSQEVFKGPIGRRPLMYMPGDYDPTDPLANTDTP